MCRLSAICQHFSEKQGDIGGYSKLQSGTSKPQKPALTWTDVNYRARANTADSIPELKSPSNTLQVHAPTERAGGAACATRFTDEIEELVEETNDIVGRASSFSVIDPPAALECEGTIDLPPIVDIVLAFDPTGSMGGVLNQGKAQSDAAIEDIAEAAPDSDIRYSVVSPTKTSSTRRSAVRFDLQSDLPSGGRRTLPDRCARIGRRWVGAGRRTRDLMTLGRGFDGPEAYGRAFWEIAQADTAEALGLRPDALVLIVNFGDNIR